MMEQSVLSIRQLSVELETSAAPVRLVHEASLELVANSTTCLVGESGSGKSVTALAVMALLPAHIRVSEGGIWLGDRDLARASESEMRAIRGSAIGLVAQDPMTTLDPLVTIGVQVADAVRAHDRKASRKAVRARVVELLRSVRITSPELAFSRYPHQYSGGMRQRVCIAMAVANHPRVIIADEPTTALDVTVQAQVLDLLDEIKQRTGAAILLITHDLGVVAERADQVAVMYAGRVVECGDVRTVFGEPRHPYTIALLGCSASAGSVGVNMAGIPGQAARPDALPAGCAFHPRCPLAADHSRCRQERPDLLSVGAAGTHRSACHRLDEVPTLAPRPDAPVVPEVNHV